MPMGKPNTDFDVIVVGAGPAGANCARELSKFGDKVLLVEKSQEIGTPNFSSAGMPNYVLEEFSLPKSVVGDYWDKLQIITAHNEFTWHYGKKRGHVLKFNELKRFLVNDAVSSGCRLLIGTSVTKPIFKNKKAVGIEFTGLEKGKAWAKIIVDASGAPGILASKIGLRKETLTAPTTGLEYIFSGVKFPKEHTLTFFLDTKIAPHGYAWIFPQGKNQAKVGIGIYDTPRFAKKPLGDLLKELIEMIPWLKNAQPVELHGSTLYINCQLNDFVKENVIAIGDAAVQINPLGAEGIRHALRSSRFAAKRIHEALTKENISVLKQYNKDWRDYIGRKWQIANFLSQIVYHKFTDEMFDKVLESAKKLEAEDVYELLFEYNFRKIFKAVRPSIKLVKFSQKLFGTNILGLLKN